MSATKLGRYVDMGADPIVFCLEHLTDYTQFERLCHELMALEGYPAIEPLGGCRDKGRDAIHVNRANNVVTIFCYSVRDDWFSKLKQDARVIHQHKHKCDRLTYLSTYDFTSAERDNAVKFIREEYDWELELFGLERLRLLLSTKHNSLIVKHPHIFHPRLFDPQTEAPEIRVIRSLIDRLIAANEKYARRNHLRLIAWHYQGEVSSQSLMNKDRCVSVAIPNPDMQDEPAPIGADVVLPKAAMRHCTHIDCWGAAGFRNERASNPLGPRLFFLIWGGPQADAAAEEFNLLAAESGCCYQSLPPSVAPIDGTTSSRNLWAAVLYGRLQKTTWVLSEVGFDCISLPFAASAELWRRLLYGAAADGLAESYNPLSQGAQRIFLAATAAKRQTVTTNSDMRGFHLGTGDGPIIETDDDRQIAECRAWVEELLSEQLIEDRCHRGQVFPVTAGGYRVADDIRRAM
jgi:hypothetical protein